MSPEELLAAIKAALPGIVLESGELLAAVIGGKYHENWEKNEYKHPPENMRGLLSGELYGGIQATGQLVGEYVTEVKAEAEHASWHEYGTSLYPAAQYMREPLPEATQQITDYITARIKEVI